MYLIYVKYVTLILEPLLKFVYKGVLGGVFIGCHFVIKTLK